ncbi:MAG: hypothetical protein LKM32_08465 [Chiayiivirga sp.]|jgi:hypothetical protein|uniref:hypothetical protein n=1 Tax=Chiayiivirga sp. TaxID=2041042 RepID=UPI0025BCF2F7|nr:hypothetical protein [Chiayiivirga sp.]MCI1708997.1 hypothetical protein [Chiayiivirga sp.]MCI1729390.1 hypothetical protein [Chiayiivirga sp.]
MAALARAALAVAATLLAACSGSASRPAGSAPGDLFFVHLASLCGQAFAGRIVANQPTPSSPDAFEGQALVMHLRECGEARLAIPFHVGDDRSRTWLLARTGQGLRLKHDHRHRDGTADAVTMYGGDTLAAGTSRRQEFPVDAESIASFETAGLTASVTNVWALELEPGVRFTYELARPAGRLFRVEFDLTRPVEPPPAPWGAE